MAATRVIVAMSGGVDSSVAALLLKDQGYEVIGITMQLWNHGNEGESRFDSCCSLSDVHDARVVAQQIGIPHYLVNYEQEFKTGVVDYFAAEYAAGRTPNPCVMCNSKLKFDHLVDRAQALGAEWVATGHFARIKNNTLLRGIDPRKDQSYFLFNLKPSMLQRIMFPLGEMNKDEVRAIASKHGIRTAMKHESQEICFVSDKRYTEFLEKNYPQSIGTAGEIVDRAGRVLGTHSGIHQFTVGQRKGLNIQSLQAKFVAAIDSETNRVIVDDLENLAASSLFVPVINWLNPDRIAAEIEAGGQIEAEVAVRYHAKPVACVLSNLDRENGMAGWKVTLFEKVKWITPGQAAVFYRGDEVLGGGFIGSDEPAAQRNNDIGVGIQKKEIRARDSREASEQSGHAGITS